MVNFMLASYTEVKAVQHVMASSQISAAIPLCSRTRKIQPKNWMTVSHSATLPPQGSTQKISVQTPIVGRGPMGLPVIVRCWSSIPTRQRIPDSIPSPLQELDAARHQTASGSSSINLLLIFSSPPMVVSRMVYPSQHPPVPVFVGYGILATGKNSTPTVYWFHQ